jgi:hypothetical protein
MHRSLAFALAVCLSAPVFAQEFPTPPPELARFDRMLGHWDGAGTVVMDEGAPAAKWTSRSSFAKVLGGFFVQEDMVIEFPGAPIPAMTFRNFYGYDTQRKRYTSVGVGNQGATMHDELHWVDENTFVSSKTHREEGRVVTERWTTTLGKGEVRFTGHRAFGAGKFFQHVEGGLKPAQQPSTAQALEAAAGLGDPSPEMVKLNRCAGTYKMKGTYQPLPDAPAMPIAGTETITPRFGGSVLEMRVVGEGFPYEAWAAWAWSSEKGCYTSIYVNNMGEISTSDMHWVGDTLVNSEATVMNGAPFLIRGEIQMNAQGAITKGRADGMMGTSKPYTVFDAVYTKQ